MADFGVVLCSENEEVIKEKPINTITSKIRNIFRAKEIQLKTNKIELYKNLNMYEIKLQYTIDDLINMKEKHLNDILRSISDICMKNNIRNCFIPEYLPEKFQTIECIKKKLSGQYLYMSLLHQIISELFPENKKDINDLEIAIINGDKEEKLFAVINLLMPKAKYLTILTEEKEYLDRNVNKIYCDTGLSISVASDMKNALKDIDLIINLNNSYELKSTFKLKPRSVIINYSESIINWTTIGNIIVNKVDIGLPMTLKSKVDLNLFKNFSNLEFSEIVLCHKYNIEDEVIEGQYNCEDMDIIAKCFKESGYKIEGFFGRRGLLKSIV
jgi:hypothetical protein